MNNVELRRPAPSAAEFPAYDVLAARFERQAKTAPDQPAILTECGTVTYRELDALADGMAALLSAEAPDEERPVALLLKDASTLIAAMLGAAKAARIYVPLDTGFPEALIAEIVKLSGAALIVADSAFMAMAKRVAGERARVFEVDRASALRARTLPVSRSARKAFSPSYILYTSGSSGRPKGVVHCHEYMVNHTESYRENLRIGPQDRVSLLTSPSFGGGIINTYATLLNGACLCPFDVKTRGINKLVEWFAAERITAITNVSSFFRTWLAAMPEGKPYPALRLVVAYSEPLYSEDIHRIAKHLTGNWMVAHPLAMTEAGSLAFHCCGPDSPPEPGVQPVGRPVRDKQILLENEDGTPAALGEAGEIVVRGPYIALGYWNDPEMTAAAFRAASAGGNLRSYRSGDLGRLRQDGKLEYLGRKDRKIKLRGYTIELYQVERALMRIPGMRDVVVMLLQDGPDDARLAAYVVASGEAAEQGGQGIRNLLAKELPHYMVPSDVVLLDALPLTSRGKVDRDALPRPPTAARTQALRAPTNDNERILAGIWQDVLKIPQVGVDDDFHELGGTSLQAFLVFARIKEAFGRDLPPTTMMKAPTIAKLAELLGAPARPGEWAIVVPFRLSGTAPPLFVVHGGCGDILWVGDLARNLRSDRPIYGLQPPPLQGNRKLLGNVEALAAHYVAEIRRLRPTGPYALSGFSFGGWVALEMAHQLSLQGEKAEFLCMIDTSYKRWKSMPDYSIPQSTPAESARTRLSRHFQSLRQAGISGVVPYLTVRAAKTLAFGLAAVRQRATRLLPSHLRKLLGLPSSTSLQLDRYLSIFAGSLHRYTPKPTEIPIAVISSRGWSKWHRKHWAPIARGGLNVREIPAQHTEMWMPHMSAVLAGAFDDCLDGTKGHD